MEINDVLKTVNTCGLLVAHNSSQPGIPEAKLLAFARQVEAFIRERAINKPLGRMLHENDVYDLIAQLLPPGHVVVPQTTVDDLCALVAKLAHCLKNVNKNHAVAGAALDYLKRKGLEGSPLRESPLPASSGPEQTKCKNPECVNGILRNGRKYEDACPDCAKDREEPKCVCSMGSDWPICETFMNRHSDVCLNYLHTNELDVCGHSRACHTPAPAAKEVMP